MATVMSKRRPAERPMSAIAGITNPRIISGIMNLSRLEKMPLKVVKMATNHVGSRRPSMTPAAMAITMRARRGRRGI